MVETTTTPMPASATNAASPLGGTLGDLIAIADASPVHESETLDKALEANDRLTAGLRLHYQSKGNPTSSIAPQYHHFVHGQDQEVDSFRLKVKEGAWTLVPISRTRFERLGAIAIINSVERILHRPPSKEEREAELNKVIYWSLGENDISKAGILRPGGFMFSEVQDGFQLFLKAGYGTGILTASVNLIPG